MRNIHGRRIARILREYNNARKGAGVSSVRGFVSSSPFFDKVGGVVAAAARTGKRVKSVFVDSCDVVESLDAFEKFFLPLRENADRLRELEHVFLEFFKVFHRLVPFFLAVRLILAAGNHRLHGVWRGVGFLGSVVLSFAPDSVPGVSS